MCVCVCLCTSPSAAAAAAAAVGRALYIHIAPQFGGLILAPTWTDHPPRISSCGKSVNLDVNFRIVCQPE